MTIVVAARHLDTVFFASDTLITNRDAARPCAIPGRVKTLVLGPRLTVAYAGLSSQANEILKKLAARPRVTREECLQVLQQASITYAPDLDFIVCTHGLDEPVLFAKVAGGQLYQGGSLYWIGDAIAANEIAKQEVPQNQLEGLPDDMSVDQIHVIGRVSQFLITGGSSRVAGALTLVKCSANGHFYQSHAGATASDFVISGSDTPETLQAKKELDEAMMKSYSYSSIGLNARTFRLFTIYIEQPQVGYIYDPVVSEPPLKIRATSRQHFESILRTYALVRNYLK